MNAEPPLLLAPTADEAPPPRDMEGREMGASTSGARSMCGGGSDTVDEDPNSDDEGVFGGTF